MSCRSFQGIGVPMPVVSTADKEMTDYERLERPL